MKKITRSKYWRHETKKHTLMRFILVLLIFVLYFIFVAYKYGLNQGLGVTLLTWSFFVFCTPIADAGFLLDFPVRLITKIRMLYSEIFVWILSLIIVVYSLTSHTAIFHKTILLKIYEQILTHPYPFWIIIFLSMAGTFLSVYFGDELMDVIFHKDRKKYIKHAKKHRLIIFFFLVLIIISLDYYLLTEFNLNLF